MPRRCDWSMGYSCNCVNDNTGNGCPGGLDTSENVQQFLSPETIEKIKLLNNNKSICLYTSLTKKKKQLPPFALVIFHELPLLHHRRRIVAKCEAVVTASVENLPRRILKNMPSNDT
eukprot:Awhi_evm1s12885